VSNADSGTKRDILDTARELFSRQGYEGTSIRQITSGLNITPAALYYHFPSKEAVLRGLADPMLAGGDELLSVVRSLRFSPAGIREAIEGYYDLLSTDVAIFRMVSRDPSIRAIGLVGDRFRDQAREYFAFVAGPEATIEGQIRAAGAVGTIRRSLELPTVDPVRDRETIISLALSILA
jgi:AcrR family transcriptional regulator